MHLGDFYLHDPRVTLVPIEHLGANGIDPAFRPFLAENRGWSARRLDLFDRAFASYWSRCAELARRTRTWPAPRLRHVAVVREPLAVRPYAQMLNTAAWTLYDGDLDPDVSHPELAAFLLAHADRMAVSGEVTVAAVHTAPWWFERSDEECAAFRAAAERSSRPDADGFRAIAAALPWLRQLRHETLRPPTRIALPGRAAPAHRAIPATGLLVPEALAAEPPALVESWRLAAEGAVARFRRAWTRPERGAAQALLAWLAGDAPRLLIAGRRETVLWNPDEPERLGALRRELQEASGAAVPEIEADLRTVDRHTRAFLASLRDAGDLPPRPLTHPEQGGYAYMHADFRLLGYNLHEPGIERLQGPALPYARAMLGARACHEWCHLAVDGGFVPQTAGAAELDEILARAGELLDAVIRDAPLAARSAAEADLRSLGPRPGRGLVDGLLERFTDYRANLLAQRYLSPAERETYVRHNIRTLRGRYDAAGIFRMLARYLYEYQYLRFSAVADRRTFFLRSTWFDDDFLRTRLLDETRFEALTQAIGAICDSFAVDEAFLRPAP